MPIFSLMVRRKFYEKIAKPILDGFCAVFLIIILSPIFLIVSLILLIHFGGSPYFFQKRVGLNEEVFKLIKFRTMKVSGADGTTTSLGRFLRSTSIDELPQLLNVLKGQMSFVGPRPLLVEYLPYYNDEEKIRHSVKPGITGWAQVNGRNSIDWGVRMEKDIFYVRNNSFFLDMKILLLTARLVLKQDKTAYMEKQTIKFSEYASKR